MLAGWRLSRGIELILLVALSVGLASAPTKAQGIDDLARQVQELDQAGKYTEALALQRRLAAVVEKDETTSDGAPGAKTADALVAVAWYALLTHDFEQALAASDRAHALAPNNLYVETNRAHALLLTGRVDQARALYLAHKSQPLSLTSNQIWEDLIADDIESLRKSGLHQPALQAVNTMLGGKSTESNADLAALIRRIQELDRSGKYQEVEAAAEKYVALARQRYAGDHPTLAAAMSWLGSALQSQGRYAEAEPVYQRALAIDEKALGPDHAGVGRDLSNLAVLYRAQGRYAEAEPLYKRALAIVEKALGPDHPNVGTYLSNLAVLYDAQGRYADAEPLYKRAIAITEKALGRDHPDVAIRLNNLAELYRAQGRYAEAEPLYQRALAIAENALGRDHPDVGTHLSNLALLYHAQGRYAEAEPLNKRALAIAEKALGPDHPDIAIRLNNLAGLYDAQGRYAEAERLYNRALAITEKALGRDHPTVGTRLNNLADLYRAQGRYAQAEPLDQRALAIAEKALGPDHPDVGTHLNNLGVLYRAQGRYAEAEPLYKRARAIAEKALGRDHPAVGTALNNLAFLYFAQSDWERATDFWRRSTGVIVRRAQRGALVGEAVTGKKKSEAEQSKGEFWGLVKAADRLASKRPRDPSLQREMFEVAQWAQSSEAATSLAQMAVRGAKGDAKLAALVRERQDLVSEWQKRDAIRSTAVAQPPERRSAQAETENVARLAAIDARIVDIDKRLAADFPDYAALVSPAPVSVESVQAQLGANEALVLFLDTPDAKPTPEETFIWVVTKTESHWVRSELGTAALRREVAALRCGLDYEGSWTDAHCGSLLKINYTHADHDALGKPLPFDLARARGLYRALFGPIEGLIKDKELLIVPSGPLTQLPFQVLVTESPKVALPNSAIDYRDVAWLARKHAITVLPAVSSLKALRQLAKQSHASEPYIGFGDPLLDGDPTKFKNDAAAAKLARQKRCDPTPRRRVASRLGLRGGSRTVPRSNGGAVDVADLRTWAPLPETADEVCDVAHDLGVDPTTHVYLGAAETETKIKQLSQSGTLAKYRILHFATHGAVAGELSGASEPGLIMTPPDKASEADDGYLSASEIAVLKLDADWVILSACNTAAGDARDAEALSGLARAFFYAGARSLLVSHWEVASESTVKLITKAVAELRANHKIGRAEALRRSMLSMIATGKDYEAHPAFWAPFVLVGEGRASR
jgi:CHAT domain-containing protein/tetratricopeptide (TPR) repeat protein